MANIEVDGPNKTIKVDSGDLTLDIPGDIILDADGANVTFKDGGTSVLDLSNSSTDAVLTVSTQDKDLIIKGDDGGSAITAATFDMSDAGTLVLNHDLKVADDGKVGSASAADAMTISSGGIVTFKDDILIKDGGTIGSASDADSITIASNGAVTFSQTPVFPDGSIAIADLDIDGGTDIGEAIVDADLFIIDNGAGGTNRKTTASRLKTYIGGGIDCDADAWARVAPTTDQDSAAVIDWATSIHMGSNISESGGVITVGTAGWYLVSIHLSNQSAFSDNMSMQLRKNNSTQLGRIYWEGNTEINYMGMDGTVLVECSANDTLDVYGTGYLSGNTNSDSLSWFTGVRLGA